MTGFLVLPVACMFCPFQAQTLNTSGLELGTITYMYICVSKDHSYT